MGTLLVKTSLECDLKKGERPWIFIKVEENGDPKSEVDPDKSPDKYAEYLEKIGELLAGVKSKHQLE